MPQLTKVPGAEQGREVSVSAVRPALQKANAHRSEIFRIEGSLAPQSWSIGQCRE
jgi:hypothetical protein